ncbi:MAG: methyltransferase domain-containing protein [Thiotrichaceae bacterium]|nr:methyltransferase domain-containing protein [Thiotrichaceae bacterium]
MIRHNILKARDFLNQSVAKVRESGFSQEFFEGKKAENKNRKPPGWVLFARETLRNPRTMGTGWPSTPQLAQAIASYTPIPETGFVIELGGGTGIVTKALLEHGVPPEHLISIEQSASLADCLRQCCPKVRIIQGDAQQMSHLLGDDSLKVNTVVSGLPFRSLPKTIGHNIIKQIDEVLPKNGLMIQFTYDLSGRKMFLSHHFKHVAHKIVWRNIPPARVDVYQSKK